MRLRTNLMRFFAIAMLSTFLFSVSGSGIAAPGDKAKGKNKANKPAGKLAPPSAEHMDHANLARYIDKAINDKLKSEGVSPSPLASDAEFLRRVYLDITGHIPTAEARRPLLPSSTTRIRRSAPSSSMNCWPAPTTVRTSRTSGPSSCCRRRATIAASARRR